MSLQFIIYNFQIPQPIISHISYNNNFNSLININKMPREPQDRLESINNNYIKDVYREIMQKYGRQSITQNQQPTNSYTINLHNIIHSKKSRTLPKIHIEDCRAHQRAKFYSNRLIMNDSVYVNERIERQPNQQQLKKKNSLTKEEFQKIDMPKTVKIRENGVLVDRNKRILELYQKVEQHKVERNQFRKTSVDDMIKIQSKEHLIIRKNRQESNKSQLTESKSQINENTRIKTTQKQLQQRQMHNKNPLKLPKMNGSQADNLLATQTLDYESQRPDKVLKCTKYEMLQRHSVKIKQHSKQNLSPPNPHNKSEIKLKMETNIVSPVRKKKFNWRNEELCLERLNKEELFGLLRRYAGFRYIQEVNSGFYRAYVGGGNNSTLIRKLIKQRSYWTIVESLEDNPHFVWTQLQHPQFSNSLPQNSNLKYQPNTLHFNDQTIQNDYQLKSFLKLKNTDFMMGCHKILGKKVFMRLARDIKERFKYNGYLQHFRKITYQALEVLPDQKQNLGGEALKKAYQFKMHNHVDGAGAIGNKKNLFYFINLYCTICDQNIHDIVPKTLHIDSDQYDSTQIFSQIPEGPWILKPGQQTNRGQGISIHITQQSLLAELSKKKSHCQPEIKYTNIIQKYIDPLLYNGRKFDIRVWILWNGSARQAWWYQEGYIRTSSKQFSYTNTNKFIHLTNDAIQSQGQDFGRFQPANKLSFNELNKYLENTHNYRGFYSQIVERMKQLAIKAFSVSNMVFNPQNKQLSFQLFGFDYIIDSALKPWLIECNTNPCLQINCSLLTRLVSNMLQNLMSLTIDTFFPPPTKRKPKQPQIWNHQTFKFELLYDGNQDTGFKEQILKKDEEIGLKEKFSGCWD